MDGAPEPDDLISASFDHAASSHKNSPAESSPVDAMRDVFARRLLAALRQIGVLGQPD